MYCTSSDRLCSQVAIRNNQQGVFYFSDTIPLAALLREQGVMQPSAFVPAWRAIPDSAEVVSNVAIRQTTADAAIAALRGVNLLLQVLNIAPFYSQRLLAKVSCMSHSCLVE